MEILVSDLYVAVNEYTRPGRIREIEALVNLSTPAPLLVALRVTYGGTASTVVIVRLLLPLAEVNIP